MQDEEMDDMIRDAANQYDPAYDDKSWSKMENLLDKHLPQKKDKRKYLLFLLLFLLLGGSAYFLFFNTNKNGSAKTRIVLQQQQNTISTESTSKRLSQNDKITTGNSEIDATKSASDNNISDKSLVNNNKDLLADNLKHGYKKILLKSKYKFRSKISNAKTGEDIPAKTSDKQIPGNSDEVISDTISNKSKINETNNIDSDIKDSSVKMSSTKSANKINADNKPDTTSASAKTIAKNKKAEHKFGNHFGFTLSGGPGFSYVGLDYLGKTTFTYGAGISYAVTKKFVLRAGFYVSSKIYSASPKDYHPPKSFWAYYPDLQKINANCKVYEIPVSVTYNFGYAKKHNWLVAAGLSSYLMKKENYDYYYIDTSGQQQVSNSEIDNKNKNIFSVLTISGGYQYHISKQFSIMAEPYIELPFDGIGFGKIKLNSSGLLFTILINPFTSR
jgi:hypothetical protein